MGTIAYKGFNKQLACRGFQFEIGKTYVKEEPPVLCSKGFHFCYDLQDVFSYYVLNDSNRFCEVEILGEVVTGADKAATNKIRIIRELKREEISGHVNQKALNSYLKLQEKFPEIILGGSLALMLQGTIPSRQINDLDVTASRYLELSPNRMAASGSSQSCYCFDVDGIKCDLFINHHAIYHTIKRDGKEIRVQAVEEIMQAKFEYFCKGATKHELDIRHFIKSRSSIDKDSGLPF